MKKIVIAPDKFKGSLSAIQFCEVVGAAIKEVCPDIKIVNCPLADGGDGTVDVLHHYIGGQHVTVEVNDPLFRLIKASYLYSDHTRTAYIEMSAASGIRLLSSDELNLLHTSTFGSGELVKDAIGRGAKHILLGIGGSATNDAGLGMARALGYRFYDKNDEELKGVGADLVRLVRIDDKDVSHMIREFKFEVACDVDNPLYGPDGAALVYGWQKGGTKEVLESLDYGLKHFSSVIHKTYGLEFQTIKGAGAAGGMGAGTLAFLNARLLPGINLVMEIAEFRSKIKDADWIITGEGRLDEQTLSGKVINGVMSAHTTQKLAIFCGSNKLKPPIKELDYLGELSRLASSAEESIAKAPQLLAKLAKQFARTYLCELY